MGQLLIFEFCLSMPNHLRVRVFTLLKNSHTDRSRTKSYSFRPNNQNKLGPGHNITFLFGFFSICFQLKFVQIYTLQFIQLFKF